MIINKLNGRLVKNITIIIIVIVMMFLTPSEVEGQTVSLSVWPPLVEVMLQPGTAVTQTFTLTNLGDNTIIQAQIFPFEPLPDGQVLINRIPSPIADFFSLPDTPLFTTNGATFPLKAGATKELVLKIRTPFGTPEADYYHTFLFSSSDLGVITGTGAKTLGSIGANILLTVSASGQPDKAGAISEFSASPCIISKPFCLLDSFSRPRFTVAVLNSGSAYFKAVGQLQIFDLFNRQVTTLPFREDNVLANSSRILNLPDWNPTFPFGRFKAVATVTPSEAATGFNQTITFFVFPYKIILILLIVWLTWYYYIKENQN